MRTTLLSLFFLLSAGCFFDDDAGEDSGAATDSGDAETCEITLSDIRMDARGVPAFDTWRGVDCAVAIADAVECTTGTDCADGGICMVATEGGPGICHPSADADIWCDGEGEAMGFNDNTCWVCAPPATHAAACCLYPEAFDCRSWPYDGTGGAGSVCACDADCRDDLVCGEHAGSGYGICQAEGAANVSPPDACWSF